MATLIRIKRFSKAKVAKETFKKGVDFVEKHPIAVSSATLAVSTANLVTNRSRHDKDREYQERQLKAMDKLTNQLGRTASSMNKVNESLKDNDEKRSNKKPLLVIKPFKK